MSSVSLVGSDASSSTGTLLASDELHAATAAAAEAAESEPALLLRSPLLSRYPSFVPLRRRATSIAEVVFLVPSATCPGRKASAAAAIFNMTATIVGGGVLSIPLSCARAGVVPFTLLMVMGAMATDLSLYLLVSCARRCGSTSFGRVCRRSFGPGMELASTAVVFIVVGFTIVGLMVLNMGIWSPLLFSGISSLRDEPATTGETTKLQDAAVLLALLGIMTHFLLKRDLTSLSHICYVGFASIAVLCVSMCYRAAERNLRHPGMFRENVKWTADSFSDALSAAPIVLLAYLCSFNIIPVQCALVNPSRRRIKGVIRWAVFLSFALMYAFGIAGYLCAYDRTDGNILLNFDPKDPIILMGRVGCGITTLFALPTNLLPCREAFLSLLAQVGEARARRGGATNGERQTLLRRRSEGEADCEDPESAGRFKKLRAAKDRLEGGNVRPNNAGYGADLDAMVPQKKNGAATKVEKPTLSEGAVHWLATVGITLLCYVAAVLAPGVAVVWDISGSSMAFLVQFILPCACYIRLKLRSGRKKASRHLVLAWALLVFSIVVSGVCTAQTAWRLSRG